jgi:hypothetical protein
MPNTIIASAITGLTSIITAIIPSFRKIKNLEAEIIQLKKEIEQLKAENDELKKIKETFMKEPLSLKEGIYFDESGNPYCAACFGSIYNRTPLRTLNKSGNWTLYRCPRCNAHYEQGERPPVQRKSWNPLDRI